MQRYICRECGRRFSEDTAKNILTMGGRMGSNPTSRKDVEMFGSYLQPNSCHYKAKGRSFSRQISVSDGETKNLVRQLKREKAGETPQTTSAEIKGKIVEYSWWMKKQGYAKSTIETGTNLIKRLVKRGADIFDPESIKEVIAQQDWDVSYKANFVDAYHRFWNKMMGQTWEPPKWKRIRTLPFIPTENEIDQLIAGCSHKVATFLQLLKETAMRSGEAWQLTWIDIDTTNNTVRITPEKGSNPRMIKISSKLVAMLQQLPKTSEKVFGNTLLQTHRVNFNTQRKRTAKKLENPRINEITFHTLRHWKATMEYHKTKDILHVQNMLGHKSIQSTMLYTQLVTFEGDEFTSKVARTLKEARNLVEAGFEYVTDMDSAKIFRKRK